MRDVRGSFDGCCDVFIDQLFEGKCVKGLRTTGLAVSGSQSGRYRRSGDAR